MTERLLGLAGLVSVLALLVSFTVPPARIARWRRSVRLAAAALRQRLARRVRRRQARRALTSTIAEVEGARAVLGDPVADRLLEHLGRLAADSDAAARLP